MRNQKNRKTLSRAIFISSFLVILPLIIAFGLFLAYHELERYKLESSRIKNEIYKKNKESIKSEVDDVIEYIAYSRSQAAARIRYGIQDRVYKVHAMGMHLYDQFQDRLPPAELKNLIIEAIRPIRYDIRFQDNSGYFFVTELNGVSVLDAARPELEGGRVWDIQDQNGRYVMRDMIAIVRNKGEGFYNCLWPKPDTNGGQFSKITFVKYFEPFDWMIGTGAYQGNMEKKIQAEVLERIAKKRLNEYGYMFVAGPDGNCLIHSGGPPHNDKNILHTEGSQMEKTVRELFKTAENGGGYVSFVRERPDLGGTIPQIAYVRSFEDWGWTVGADVCLYELDRAATARMNDLKTNVKMETIFLGVIFVLASAFAIIFAKMLSNRIKRGIMVFTDFFAETAVSHTKIDAARFPFLEFKWMAEFANKMVDDRKAVETALRENEKILRQLTTHVEEALYVFDCEKQKFLYISPAYEKIWEASVQQVMSHPEAFADAIHPGDRKAFENAAGREREHGDYLNLEHRIITPGGRVKWIWSRNFPVLDDHGNPVRIVGVSEDITRRKMSEKLLAEREEQFRTVFNRSPQPMSLTDAQTGKMIEVNDILCKKVSAPKERLLGRTVTELGFYSDEDRAVFINALYKNGTVEGLEMKFTALNGDTFICRMFSRFITVNAQKYVLTVFEDITEQKVAQAQLLKQKEQFELAVKGSNDGIWDWDIQTGYLYLSPKWKEQLGYSEEELKNEVDTFTGLVHEADREGVWNHIQAYLDGKIENYDFEFRMIHKNGEYRWIRARGEALRDADGKPCRMAGSHTDITGRKKKEIELKEKENLLSSIIDTLPGTLNVIDPDYRIIRVNNAACRMKLSGFDRPDGLIGGKCHEVFMKRDTPCPWCRIQQVFETGAHLEETTSPGDPREIMTGKAFHIFLAPIKSEDGRVTGVIEYGIDITAIRDAKNAAEAANKAKSEFLANMSHEIRTPMNGVIGMTGLLLDTQLTSEQRRYANTIRASGESLLGIINDILDFSKIEAGRLEMEILDFDLRILMDDISETTALKAHEKGLEFVCAASPDVPVLLRGDPGRLRQILMNLAGNAVKFTKKGEITVRADREWETDEDIMIRFSVRDTGPGVSAEQREILFQQFTQADASITRQYGGTGLGLAISKQLTEMMNGEIGVISGEGRGAEFWFTARFQKTVKESRHFILPHGVLSARVLVADDSAANRENLLEQLRAWGIRADSASSGEQALKLLRGADNDPYMLAIINKRMPDMDGEKLGGRIKADPSIAQPRLILMTALGWREEPGRLAKTGFSARIDKPVRQSELFDRLSAVLSGASSGKSVEKSMIDEQHAFRKLKGRILLAEDNIVNQQVALGVLKKLGLHADAAANGAEAVEALKSIPYDLVLMDIQMPQMDGLEAARIIRGRDPAVLDPDIPIVALTAHAMRGDREKYLDAGMNDYISKPLSSERLARVLEKWLLRRCPDADSEARETCVVSGVEDEPRESPSVWDRDDFRSRMMNDDDLIASAIELFLEDTPKQIRSLQALIGAREIREAGARAHSIKGAAANISSPALHETARKMEKAAQTNAPERIEALYTELENAFESLRAALEFELEARAQSAKDSPASH